MSSVRDYEGRYASEAALTEGCRCGHDRSDHHVLAAHRCLGDSGACRCEKFRRRINKTGVARNLVAAGRAALAKASDRRRRGGAA